MSIKPNEESDWVQVKKDFPKTYVLSTQNLAPETKSFQDFFLIFPSSHKLQELGICANRGIRILRQ